ncbi:hypothetical protein F511_21684 [Dorcoceras hygrometricum]|uniref:Uncharacterized protein n=1 Tax=Dorcoceras hygrometricum TaxID=472368 RepID=A0A2Z7CQC5_9LAMI|nr:hypothetical protein F511_21684 [Dorcoceras hygrometricum]
MATIVLKDPSLSSDTTVGKPWRIRIPTCVTLNGSGIQLAVGPQPLWLRNHNFGLAQRIMVKRLVTSRHDPLGMTDSACKNQLVVVSIQYGSFNPYIPIRSTTIGKSRVVKDPIAMHTSWRSNSDIASVTRVSMTFRVVRTNQYNQDLGLIHSTNGNHLESPNEGSSIDHQSTHSAASLSSLAAAPVGHHAAAASPRRSCYGQPFEEFPSVMISSGLIVQADEGVSIPVMDLIDESTAAYREEPVFL